MDAIEQALQDRVKLLAEEQAKNLEEHRLKMALINEKEEKARTEREAKKKAEKEETERKMRLQKEVYEAKLREERRKKSEEEAAYSLRQYNIALEKKQIEELEQKHRDLERMAEKAEQEKKDAEALLAPQVDTERIMPNPLARFFQSQE